MIQECTALHLGLRPLSRAYAQLSAKVKSEEEDLQRLADIWSSYRPSDGRPSNLRAGALRDFRKGYVFFPFLSFLFSIFCLIWRCLALLDRTCLGILLIFRYFRKVVQDSEERIPRYKQSIIVSSSHLVKSPS
jgi:hypothetical protein